MGGQSKGDQRIQRWVSSYQDGHVLLYPQFRYQFLQLFLGLWVDYDHFVVTKTILDQGGLDDPEPEIRVSGPSLPVRDD